MVRARGAIGWWDMIRFTRVTVGYLQAIVQLYQLSTDDVKDQVMMNHTRHGRPRCQVELR